MVDQQEIILMTKLALHEKKYGKEDKNRNSYFKWDYIYINNWYSRFAAGFAALMIIGWMILKDVYIKEIIPVLDVALEEYLAKYVILFGAIILVYTGVSTLIFHKRYEKTQKRIDEYDKIVKELDIYQNTKQLREEGLDDTFQPDITNSGPMY